MPTLYVENVPKELYEALRSQARKKRSSIAAEVIDLLRDNLTTADELKRRREFYDRLAQFRSHKPSGKGPFPSAEEMIREDRER
jgi:plasmid stability protein